MSRIDAAAGERTPYPVDQLTQMALDKLEGDDAGRVVVRLEIPELTDSDEWEEATDLLTGHTVAVRRADCGLGCKCAAEVKLVRYAEEFPAGSRVIWTDPDGGQRKPGKVESTDEDQDTLYLAFDDGGYAEVFTSEVEGES